MTRNLWSRKVGFMHSIQDSLSRSFKTVVHWRLSVHFYINVVPTSFLVNAFLCGCLAINGVNKYSEHGFSIFNTLLSTINISELQWVANRLNAGPVPKAVQFTSSGHISPLSHCFSIWPYFRRSSIYNSVHIPCFPQTGYISHPLHSCCHSAPSVMYTPQHSNQFFPPD